MVQAPCQFLSLEEFLKLPETKPASEYIDGKIIQKPMPQGKHSVLQTELATAINAVLKPQRIARAFTELRCTFGGRSIVPDLSIFRWDRIVRDQNGEVANSFEINPDWTIEILSPDQNQTKVTKNILHGMNHKTEMGWLIDPAERAIFIFRPKQQTEVFEDLENPLPVPSFAQEFKLKSNDLFAWLLSRLTVSFRW